MLGAAALLALALSLVGLALTVTVELRDEVGELFDLETQGMGPAALRHQVRLRAGAVLLAGLVGGLLLGAVLALVVLKALAVSANSTTPVPPLVLAPDWPLLIARLCRLRRARARPGRAAHACRVPRADRDADRGGRMTPAVEVEDVFRVYATDEGTAAALQGLSLTVQEGEVVAVLGPSGSGKTTLLRILAGLDRPSAGRVRVAGVDLRRLRGRGLDRYRSRQLGYADQRYTQALAPELTAGELVSLRLALAGESPREQRRRTTELLGQVGLADRVDAYPHELSGGEQQRVALCAALAHRPQLLLADEPTGELDAKNAAVVYELIGELARAQGTTAIVVSHDPGSASIADRIVHIRDGRVSAEQAKAQPDSEEIVVARGGWLRVPEELLRRGGIGSRARARLAGAARC